MKTTLEFGRACGLVAAEISGSSVAGGIGICGRCFMRLDHAAHLLIRDRRARALPALAGRGARPRLPLAFHAVNGELPPAGQLHPPHRRPLHVP